MTLCPITFVLPAREAGHACYSQRISCCTSAQIFPGLILSDIKPAKRMKFKTVCYLLVQLMHCRKMFKAEIPFSNVMTCEDDDKVGWPCPPVRWPCRVPTVCPPSVVLLWSAPPSCFIVL